MSVLRHGAMALAAAGLAVGLLALAEGWHRGPTVPPEEDPTKLGPILLDLQERARKNAGMNGMDLD